MCNVGIMNLVGMVQYGTWGVLVCALSYEYEYSYPYGRLREAARQEMIILDEGADSTGILIPVRTLYHNACDTADRSRNAHRKGRRHERSCRTGTSRTTSTVRGRINKKKGVVVVLVRSTSTSTTVRRNKR